MIKRKLRNKKIHAVLWGMAVFLILYLSLSAQSTLVTLEGAVTDEEGAFLPGAGISVKNVETGFEYSGVSRADGRYVISGIQPGKYEMEVTLSGFASQKRQGLTVNLGARLEINFKLTQAAIEQELTVTAEAPMVEVTKSDISGVVDRRQIDDLPLLDRNFMGLNILKSGVQSDEQYIKQTGHGDRGGAQPHASSETLIDGVSNEWTGDNVERTNIPADAIQEFRIITNLFEAEFGNASALLTTAITRSGTNEFRGRASMFYRDEAFDSVNYFINHEEYQGPELAKGEWEKPDFSRYNFSAFLGGPIKKDKAHFFFAYEGLRRTEYSTITSPLVPKETVPVTNNNNQVLFKLNYQLNEKNLFSFRYSLDYPIGNNSEVGGLFTRDRAVKSIWRANDFQANWTFYPTDKTMNELRILYSNSYVSFECADPNAYSIERPSGFFGKNPDYPQKSTENRYQFVDNLSIFLGDHTIKIGFDLATCSFVGTADAYKPGVFTFTTDEPFNAADFLTYPLMFFYNAGASDFDYPVTIFGAFVQDSWRILPRLTLNYGIRYNYYHIRGLDLVAFDLRNFNPRLGISWDPVGDGKTVIRGGIGTYSSNPPINAGLVASLLNEWDLQFIIFPNYPDPFQPNPFFPPMQGGISLGEYGAIDNQVPPYTLQTVLGFQREIAGDILIGADLVYARGYRNIRMENLNPVIPGTSYIRMDPDRGDVFLITDNARSEYKALYLTLRKRYAQGWALDVSYTLSEAKSDVESESNQAYSYEEDAWRRMYGPTARDARHRLAVTGIVDLPLGFQLSGIFYYRSALPWTGFYEDDVNLDSLNTDMVDEYRNARRGFDLMYLNTRISKYLNLSRLRIQLFGEIYNLTNNANFRNVFNIFESPLFGKPLSAGDPRLIQIGARLDF